MIEYGGVIYKCRRLILLSVLIYIGSVSADSLPLHQLNLPAGFRIAVFAKVENPRQLAISQSGVIFAGSRKAGKVHGLIDQDGDAYAETVLVLAEDLTMPSGLAIRGNDLYIAELRDILKNSNIDQRLKKSKHHEII